MPIRWYGPADPADPTYRHFERIVNLTLHAMVFAALNSGLWVLQGLRHPWSHLGLFSAVWAVLVLIHASVVVGLRPAPEVRDADRSAPVATPSAPSSPGPLDPPS